MKKITMKQLVKLSSLLLLLVTLASCNRSNGNDPSTLSDSFLAKLQSLMLNVSEEQAFPEWFLNKISEIEALHAKDVAIVKVRIYHGEWNGQHYYLILDNLSSCILCEIYDETGTKNSLTGQNADEFYATSKDWNLIYEFGNGIIR
jgi:hypothetical protein